MTRPMPKINTTPTLYVIRLGIVLICYSTIDPVNPPPRQGQAADVSISVAPVWMANSVPLIVPTYWTLDRR